MLSSFSLIVTGDCNFDCRYCYQERDGRSLASATARKAIDFFFPYFDTECAVIYCGGEPLLRKDTIRETVGAVVANNRGDQKKISFTISTNGSLLDDEILAFFGRHRFTLLLSFDGLAQEKGRKKGSFPLVSDALERLLGQPGIEVLTNSVFTPDTVDDLSASIRGIIERGVRDVQISFATNYLWREDGLARLEAQLSDLRDFLLSHLRRTGQMPVSNFKKASEPSIFGCLAGETRMALSPDGRLWGCHLFYDLHQKLRDSCTGRYCFGSLEAFMAHPERSRARVLPAYADLRMDFFHTPRKFCGLCEDVPDCVICPADAAFSSGIIGRIPTQECRIMRIVRKEKALLWRDLEERGSRNPSPRGRRTGSGLTA